MISGVLGILFLVVGTVLSCRYYFPFRLSKPSNWPRVLVYHACDKDVWSGMPIRLNVVPSELEKQIRWLKRKGYAFLTVTELVALGPDANKGLHVCLTFDDGFEDNYTCLFPLLKKYNVKATVFAGQRSTFPGKPMLNPSQMKELSDSGLVEFGGHTNSHVNLKETDDAEAEKEILGNKEWIESIIGRPVTSFAYPFGHYTKRDMDILRKFGFRGAVCSRKTVEPLGENVFEIPRLYVSGKCRIFQFPLIVKKCKYRS